MDQKHFRKKNVENGHFARSWILIRFKVIGVTLNIGYEGIGKGVEIMFLWKISKIFLVLFVTEQKKMNYYNE